MGWLEKFKVFFASRTIKSWEQYYILLPNLTSYTTQRLILRRHRPHFIRKAHHWNFTHLFLVCNKIINIKFTLLLFSYFYEFHFWFINHYIFLKYRSLFRRRFNNSVFYHAFLYFVIFLRDLIFFWL